MTVAGPPTQTAWYVYAVVPAREAAGLTVSAVTEGPLAALADQVPAGEFAEDELHGRLEDPAWLEAQVRRHDAAVERALEASAVVPFRFATLYRDEADLRRMLVDRRDALEQALARVRGRVELGVKAFLDRTKVPEEEPAGREISPGRAYLLERARERARAEEADRFAAECAEASHERLAAAAVAAVANPVQRPEAARRAEPMILNGAYLVARDDDGLERAVAELARRFGPRGVEYELTGPWAPYNFVPAALAER